MKFQDVQKTFTDHMRDPARHPAPPDVEERRVAVYRGLLYRNVNSFLGNYFPVIKRIVGDAAWDRMIRDYFATHRARTPYFPKMALEFIEYLEVERRAEEDPPFLVELARYEWLEAEVLLDSREFPESETDPDGDLGSGLPVVNPVMRVQAFAWPVHELAPDFKPDEPPAEPTYLAVFRRRDETVHFMHLNPVSARLLALLLEREGSSGRAAVEQIARELNHPRPEVVIEGGLEALEKLRGAGVLLGTRRAAAPG